VTLLLQLKQVIPQVLHPQTGFKFHDVGPIPIIQTYGGTIKEHLDEKKSLPLKDVKNILLQIAEGL